MTDRPYRPIDCGLHDLLLDRATRRLSVEIVHHGPDGVERVVIDRIVDVYTEAGAEYLRSAAGVVIRLDDLLRVDGIDFVPGAGRPAASES